MFYSPDLLSTRKKGKFSRCWLAGTLSDRMFKKTVSNKVVLSIDIQVTCNEILKYINSKDRTKHSRFSLYMSAQLMFGAVKLFRIQATLFQDSLFRIKTDLNPIDLAPRKKKTTGEITLRDELLVDPPPVEFGDLQREDQHLLIEAHLEMLGDAAFKDYVVSPNFGALTEEEADFILFNEGDIRLFASIDHHGRTIDESREQLRSPGQTTVVQNLGLSDALPANEQSANPEITAERISTPRKRRSTAAHLDTPTKKRRREFRQEIDAHPEEKFEDVAVAFPADAKVPLPDEFAAVPPQEEFTEIPPVEEVRPLDTIVELPADFAVPQIDKSVGLPPEAPAVPQIDESLGLPPEAPAVPAPDAQENIVDMRQPVDSNLHLESLESEAPRPSKVRRGRITRQIDEITVLPNSMIGKTLFGNPSVRTIEFIPPVTDRKRGMLAAGLLVNPTTNYRCSGSADSSRWAQQLIPNFVLHTMGPFVAEYDESMSIEAIRFAESETQAGPVEISKGHRETTGLEHSSRDKTVEKSIPVDYDSLAGPIVPEMPGNVPDIPMDIQLPNITDEPTLADISEAQEMNLPPEIEVPPIPQNNLDDLSEAQVDPPPEIEVPPIIQNILADPSGAKTVTCNTKLQLSDVRESVTATEKPSSDLTTTDSDAFLPPKLRKKSHEKKATQKKSSSSEAIINICDSPASIRSQLSDSRSTWNIPELKAYLGIAWYDNPLVKLEELLPPEETKRLDAAVCFNMLLQLSKDGKVFLKQREAYGPIYISKRTTASTMDSD